MTLFIIDTYHYTAKILITANLYLEKKITTPTAVDLALKMIHKSNLTLIFVGSELTNIFLLKKIRRND